MTTPRKSASDLHNAIAIARLEERLAAQGNKFDAFYVSWMSNAVEVKSAIQGIATRIESHKHEDLCTKTDDTNKVVAGLTTRVDDISGGIRRGNVLAGVGIPLAAIFAGALTWLDIHFGK
jgi:hypothetical protein